VSDHYPVRMTCLLLCAACGADGYSGPTANLAGMVYEYQASGYQAPIPGAKVCVVGEPSIDCANTDMFGKYELRGAPIGETAVVFSAESFTSSVATVTLDADAELSQRLATHNDLLLLSAAAGVTLKAGTGLIVPQFYGLAGATVSISPSKGDGPVYFNAENVPDPSLTSTTKSGLVAFGNLPPGEYTVTYEHPAATFRLDLPWAWSDGDGARTRVIADAISGFTVFIEL
jgi:hypothetical protein